jgi:hypothetical protein
MGLKFFEIKVYEDIPAFLRRVKFEVSGLDNYTVKHISEIMGKGVRVITLINNLISSQVKLEIEEKDVDDIIVRFKLSTYDHRTTLKNDTKRGLNTLGLDDIGDSFK